MKRISLPYRIGSVVIIVGIATVLINRDATPYVSRQTFEAARDKWNQAGITTYELLVDKQLDGRPLEQVRTLVEDGVVKAFYINDGQIEDVRDSYSAEGLFDIVERELEMLNGEEQQPGQPKGVMLRAEFDDETGLPVIFKRLSINSKSVFLTVKKLFVPERGVIFPRES